MSLRQGKSNLLFAGLPCTGYDHSFTQKKMSLWSDSQSSSGDVHVFTSSFRKTTDAKITASVTCASVRVVN